MRQRPIVLSLVLAGLGLVACNKQTGQNPAAPATGAPIASLPLAQGAPPPLIAAPALASLPAAQPVRVAAAPPRERYRYIDRAYALGEAFADSPPDYTVDYEGVRPWIWRSGDGDYRVVEPTPDGDRTYYFEAGSDEPFLVRDPEYAYGYDQGGLAVIYDASGRPVGYDPGAADRAARYLARARALHDAAMHQQRQAAYAAAWRERSAQVLAQQRAWEADQQRDAAWRQWRQDHQQQQAADLDREREMRLAYAARTAAVINAARNERREEPPPPPPAPQGGPPAPGFPPRQEAQQQFQAQQQAQAAQRAQAEAARQAQAQATRQQAEAARNARAEAAQQARQQAATDHAARQAQLAQQAASRRQAAEAARNARQAQVEAERQAHSQAEAARASQAAQQQAARRQADAGRQAQQAQAQVQHQAEAQAARQAAAQRAAQNAQAEAARRAQAQAAHNAQAEAAQRAQQHAAAARARQGQDPRGGHDRPKDRKDHPNGS